MAKKKHFNSRDKSPASAQPPQKIQVKSQNPITDPLDSRSFRAPKPALIGNYASGAPSSAPTGYYSSPKDIPLNVGASPTAAPSPSAARSTSSSERIRGGSPDVKARAKRAASPKYTPTSSPRPQTPKSPLRSLKTPSFVAPDVITPVFPTSPEDMAGALTSMETGLTYPWNIWGPVTKYGYLDDVEPTWSQKYHFQGKPVSSHWAHRVDC